MNQLDMSQMALGFLGMQLLILLESVYSDGIFFKDEGANKGYPQVTIIEKMTNVSLIQCILRCRRYEGCKHIAFHEGMCSLLTASNFTREENVMTIFSPFPPNEIIKQGMCVYV